MKRDLMTELEGARMANGGDVSGPEPGFPQAKEQGAGGHGQGAVRRADGGALRHDHGALRADGGVPQRQRREEGGGPRGRALQPGKGGVRRQEREVQRPVEEEDPELRDQRLWEEECRRTERAVPGEEASRDPEGRGTRGKKSSGSTPLNLDWFWNDEFKVWIPERP